MWEKYIKHGSQCNFSWIRECTSECKENSTMQKNKIVMEISSAVEREGAEVLHEHSIIWCIPFLLTHHNQ
jgi:hypothetical protein